MKWWDKVNRWIKFISKTSKVFKNNPELVDKVIRFKDPENAYEEYFSKEEMKMIEKLRDEKGKLQNQVDKYQRQVKQKKKDLREVQRKLDEYTIQMPPELTKEDTHLNYDGRRLIPTRDKVQIKNELKQDDYFHPTKKLKEVAEKYGVETSDSDFEKFRKCLKAVQEEYDYIHDDEQYGVTEHFTLSFEVDATGKDDCESLALTVIDMYLECGGDPEKIYWCLGHVVRGNSSYGHGWVGFRKENGDWFIGEATHSSYNAPDFWKESYQADWGLSNLGGMYRFKEQKKPWENTDIKQSSNFKEYDNKEKDKVLTEIWR